MEPRHLFPLAARIEDHFFPPEDGEMRRAVSAHSRRRSRWLGHKVAQLPAWRSSRRRGGRFDRTPRPVRFSRARGKDPCLLCTVPLMPRNSLCLPTKSLALRTGFYPTSAPPAWWFCCVAISRPSKRFPILCVSPPRAQRVVNLTTVGDQQFSELSNSPWLTMRSNPVIPSWREG